MFTRRLIIPVVLMLVGALALLAACATPEPETIEVEVTRIVEVTREVEVIVEVTPDFSVPFEEQWANSPHADASSESFTHWDEEDPAEVPDSCAKCHTTSGYQDFIGLDGSEAGVVDTAHPIGQVISCENCHNDVTVDMDTVSFPSGNTLTGLGAEARCMQCHQGRASGVTVDAKITELGLGDDEVSADLGFTNIHYYAAAVSQWGTLVSGGYQYEGQSYDAKTDHVEGYDTCVGCHNPHTLEVELEGCTTCHEGADSVETLRDLRMASSLQDYDGDGDVEEGVYYEIEGVRDVLYGAMQAYSAEVVGTGIIYAPDSYPYFFNDTNGNGEADEDEVNFGNAYASWTPRLARAAYNFQTSLKDPGAYAHGGKYIIQLLYDSTANLNESLGTVDMSRMVRNDAGHFAGSEEAFRHWDEDLVVPGSCARCHTGEGLPTFLTEGVNVSAAPSNGLQCETCHNDLVEFTLYTVDSVPFPSGARLSFGEGENANLCMECHQGRSSGAAVDRAVAGLGPDEVGNLRFINIHYFAAGATLFGSEAGGIYEYEGQTYSGQFQHNEGRFVTCDSCHNVHTLEVDVAECTDCHEVDGSPESYFDIRESEADYDGDGDVTEGIASEVATFEELLYVAIQDYAATTVGTPIVYNPAQYPYWFDEAGEGYSTWTPRLLKAAYNYQYVAKDPGAFAHNADYVMQAVYDSIRDLGGDVSTLTRPTP